MADFKFYCPGCGQKMQASDDMIGDRMICPICHREFHVPTPHAPVAPSGAHSSEQIACVFCRRHIPNGAVFCDICGKRQPARPQTPAAPADNAVMESTSPNSMARLLLWLIILVAAAAAGWLLWTFLHTPPPPMPPPVAQAPTFAEKTNAADLLPASTSTTARETLAEEITVITAPLISTPDSSARAKAPEQPPTQPPPVQASAAPTPKPPPAKPPAAKPPPSNTTDSAAVPPTTDETEDPNDEIIGLFEKTQGKYRAVLQEIERAYQSRIVAVQTNFLGSLDTLEKLLQEKGDLMGVLAIRKEKEAFQKIRAMPPIIPSVESELPPLKTLKQTYNQQLDLLAKDKGKEIVIRSRQYDNRLAEFERRLTQAGRIDDALRVHRERENVAATIKASGDK